MDGVVQADDYKKLKQAVLSIQKEKQPFERIVLTKDEALEMFKVWMGWMKTCSLLQYNKFKTEIIKKKVPDGETCTAYRCGPLIDLCKGPHVPHTGYIKAFSITKVIQRRTEVE